MSHWIWFYDLVDNRLGPVLAEYHFTKLTGKAYEGDDIDDAAVFYISDSGTKAFVDIRLRYDIEESDLPLVYLIRVFVAKDTLKEWLYPNIRAVTKDVDLWDGWKCPTVDDAKNAFDEIQVGLQKYLAEYEQMGGDTPLVSPDSP